MIVMMLMMMMVVVVVVKMRMMSNRDTQGADFQQSIVALP